MATKKPTAAQLAARKLFAARAKAGTLKKATKRKPAAKRAKNPIARSLKNKRAVSTSRHSKTVASWNDRYQVQVRYSETSRWEHIAGGILKTQREAEAFANQLHRLNPDLWIRVVTPD
jgi:hypothetical protein